MIVRSAICFALLLWLSACAGLHYTTPPDTQRFEEYSHGHP